MNQENRHKLSKCDTRWRTWEVSAKITDFYQIIFNMAVGWYASLCMCVWRRQAERAECRWEWRDTMRHSLSECILAGGREGWSVWKWMKEGENNRGKMDINGYELALPTSLFFFCSWSKLRPLTQQLGCFSGHAKSCAKREARPKSIVNLMEWKTLQPTKRIHACCSTSSDYNLSRVICTLELI